MITEEEFLEVLREALNDKTIQLDTPMGRLNLYDFITASIAAEAINQKFGTCIGGGKIRSMQSLRTLLHYIEERTSDEK